MKHKVVAPSVGESIQEVSILKWNKTDGSAVNPGDVLLEIESDKATVEVVAEQKGVLKIFKTAGTTIPIGELVGEIDDAGSPSATAAPTQTFSSAEKTGTLTRVPTATTPSAPMSAAPAGGATLSPSVQKLVTENNLDPRTIPGTGKDGRITKGDVLGTLGSGGAQAAPNTGAGATAISPTHSSETLPGQRRVPMTRIRMKIAERLVQAQHTAAILTTFNEIDMSGVNRVRSQHKDSFKAKHGVGLSFMSFFTRACVEALKKIQEVNAYIDGTDVLYHDYQDIGIAVGTDRGLVVPVLRNAGKMGFVQIEKGIGELAIKARDGKLSIADMSGGTFTISNGGTYGSLLSTPILNPPQSGILGMHKIMDRPIAVNGKIEIRPMMYVALSYDHRIIDGKEAVTFLVMVKDFIENPEKLGLDFI